jgi:hypothetical protein
VIRAEPLLRQSGLNSPAFILEAIMPEPAAFPTFRGRELELNAMEAGPSLGVRVLNFHGEAGIGKSRLLAEGGARLSMDGDALVCLIDMEILSEQREGRASRLLEEIREQSPMLARVSGLPDAMTAQLGDQVSAIAAQRRITFLFDTTEAVQDDTDFWQWFESSLLSPFVGEDNVLVVLAGRLPAPIRLVEVRRYLKVWPLQPLSVDEEARRLVREVLAAGQDKDEAAHREMTERSEQSEEELCDLALSFSHGHPLLSQKIAGALAGQMHTEPVESLRRRIAEEVVRPFIDKELFPFKGEMLRWRPLMEWASVLEWFDATVFYRFVAELSGPLESEIEWQYGFVKAIAQLRAPYAVVRWEQAGYTLVGTVKSIVASYMQVARREEYVRALQAAAVVFDRIVGEYFADNPQAGEPYRRAARAYERRLQSEVQYATAQ